MTTVSGKRGVYALFFLFGFSTMGWIARFPEVKAHLRLTNGEFGTVLSLGTIGGVISLLTVGHIVHRFGSYRVMLVASTVYLTLIGTVVHLTSVPLFIVANVILGMSIAAFHISINAQALHEQDRTGELLTPKAAGFWSSGALLTLLLSGVLTSHVPIGLHIDLVEGASFLFIMFLLRNMQDHCLQPHGAAPEVNSFTNIFRNFHVNWPISIGMLMGVQIEFSSGDWATIYTKEDLSFGAGVATIPYISFMFAMILGRLAIRRVSGRYALENLVRIAGVVGGSGFLVGLVASHFLKSYSPNLAFLAICFAFLIGGFGSSFLGPIFLNAANRASDSPGGVVVGQLGVVNNSLVFLVKAIIAWTAQWLSLSIALLIPGIMLIAVSLFAKVVTDSSEVARS